jgi:hypothetical protein
MNMTIRGIDFNFGKEPANSFTSDQHPDLRADCEFVRLRDALAAMTNPRLEKECLPATSDRVSRLAPVSIFR